MLLLTLLRLVVLLSGNGDWLMLPSLLVLLRRVVQLLLLSRVHRRVVRRLGVGPPRRLYLSRADVHVLVVETVVTVVSEAAIIRVVLEAAAEHGGGKLLLLLLLLPLLLLYLLVVLLLLMLLLLPLFLLLLWDVAPRETGPYGLPHPVAAPRQVRVVVLARLGWPLLLLLLLLRRELLRLKSRLKLLLAERAVLAREHGLVEAPGDCPLHVRGWEGVRAGCDPAVPLVGPVADRLLLELWPRVRVLLQGLLLRL